MTQSNYDRIMVGVRLPPDRPETWKPHPRFPLYEVSDKGRRRRNGRILAQRVSNRGYWQMDFVTDDGQKVTVSAHVAVLDTFEGYPCPEGLETLHGEYGPLVNWWPENIWRDTKKANAAMRPFHGGTDHLPCLNHSRCGGMVRSEGRRCKPCVTAAAKLATEMLVRYGMSLDEVTRRLKYENTDWVYRIARELGGYEGTKRDARLQRPSLRQRVTITVRDRRAGGWSDAA